MKQDVTISRNFVRACVDVALLYNNTKCCYYEELNAHTTREWGLIILAGMLQFPVVGNMMHTVSRNTKCTTTEGRQ